MTCYKAVLLFLMLVDILVISYERNGSVRVVVLGVLGVVIQLHSYRSHSSVECHRCG